MSDELFEVKLLNQQGHEVSLMVKGIVSIAGMPYEPGVDERSARELFMGLDSRLTTLEHIIGSAFSERTNG